MHFFAIYCAENHVLRTLCGRLHRPKKTWSREQLVVSTHHRFARRNANSQLLSAQFSHSFRMFHVVFSEWFTMFHHVASFLTCVHHVFTIAHVSQCFRLFYIGKWSNDGENIGKWLFHQCFTYVHHFSMVLQNYCWPFLKPLFTHCFFRFSHMLNRCFTICNTMIKPFCVTCSHLSWLILTLAIRMWQCFDIINSQNMCHTGSTSRQVAAQALCRQRAIASWQLNQQLWLCIYIYIMYKDDVYIYIYVIIYILWWEFIAMCYQHVFYICIYIYT